MKKTKVVIIGAGPAGLTAGYELLKKDKNYDVTILESSNDIGGISKTINYNGNRMDIGGHRFFSKDPKVNEFWQEILPLQGKPSIDDLDLKREKKLAENGPDPQKEDCIMLKRHRVSRIYYLNKFFDYPVSLSWSTIKNLGFVRTMKSGFSYLKSLLWKKEEDSLENFYINRFGKKLYSMFFEGYTEKLWGRHPKEIDASWGSQRVKGISITEVLKNAFSKMFHLKNKKVETSLIEEYYYPKYGPGQLWEQVAIEFEKMGGKVLKNHEVTKINVQDKKIVSVVCQEKEIQGDIFISSMPIKDLIADMNNVPEKIADIANNLPYRDFVTVGLLVKNLKIKNQTAIKTYNELVPDCWIYVQDTKVKLGRIQIFNNWSPYLVKNPKNTVWLGLEYFCNEGDQFWNLSEEECVKLAINELEKIGIIDSNQVIDSHREKIKKAYPAYFDSYEHIDEVITYLNEIPNLYCVGRNGQHRYNNMDHSMMTSFNTVECIINNNPDKSSIWNVNTEQEYHESAEETKKIKKKPNFNIPFLNKKNFLLLYLLVSIFLITAPWYIDNDSWFIFTHGRYILNNGFPYIEPFTIHEGLNFVMQQWLFALILYLCKFKFGVKSLFFFVVTVNLLIVFVLHKLCMVVTKNNYKIAIPIAFLIDFLLIKLTFIRTRPQIFSYVLIPLFIYLIELYRTKGNKKTLFLLPLVSILEVNVHASMWAFLYVYSMPFIAELVIQKFTKESPTYKVKPLIIALIASVLAGFINPYGYKAMLYFFTSINKGANIYIYEMQTPSVFSKEGLCNILLIGIFIGLSTMKFMKKGKVEWRYIFLTYGSFILALTNKKSIAYFVIFSLYPAAYYLNILLTNEEASIKKAPSAESHRLLNNSLLAITALTIVFSFAWNVKINLDEPDYKIEKEAILSILKDNENNLSDLKVYCNYDMGGYLEYHGIKAYIDPRAEVFYYSNNGKEEIFNEYLQLQASEISVDAFLAKYNFTHLYLAPNDFLSKVIDVNGDETKFKNYTIIYSSLDSKVYVRDDLLKKDNSKDDDNSIPTKKDLLKKYKK